MGKLRKLLSAVLSGSGDTATSFTELCHLLKRLGFSERIAGSHHLYSKPGVVELINLQEDGKHAKPYQVRQVRSVLVKYRLGDADV